MRGNRQSIRLPGYDYTLPGAYFVTLCVQNRECLFGEIHKGEMRLNEYGHYVFACWNEIPNHFPGVELDAFVVMPNHLHGVLIIKSPVVGSTPAVASHGMPLALRSQPHGHGPRRSSLGAIIAVFKSAVGRRINEIRQTPGVRVWQRNFYDHIIRHDTALYRIRRYIEFNPLKWERDHENPGRDFPR